MKQPTIMKYGSLVLATLSVAVVVLADAATPSATMERSMQDPWIPPTTRAKATSIVAPAPTRGDALRLQVEAKLKADFDRADTAKTGLLTREQARMAGLGFIANHFDVIDRSKTGLVQFEDVTVFLNLREKK